MKIYIVLIFAFLLTGCATSPVSIENANKVEANRLYNSFYKYAVAHNNKGKVVIVRDSGLLGGGVSAGLFVNGCLELLNGIVETGSARAYYLGEHMIRSRKISTQNQLTIK